MDGDRVTGDIAFPNDQSLDYGARGIFSYDGRIFYIVNSEGDRSKIIYYNPNNNPQFDEWRRDITATGNIYPKFITGNPNTLWVTNHNANTLEAYHTTMGNVRDSSSDFSNAELSHRLPNLSPSSSGGGGGGGGGGLTANEVDTRISAGVHDWAETGK